MYIIFYYFPIVRDIFLKSWDCLSIILTFKYFFFSFKYFFILHLYYFLEYVNKQTRKQNHTAVLRIPGFILGPHIVCLQ